MIEDMNAIFRAYFAPMFLANDTRTIAEALIGTAEPIQAVISRLGLDALYDSETDLDTAVFDSIVFDCQGCNWWCSMDENHEIDGEWFCDDCAKERGGTDD